MFTEKLTKDNYALLTEELQKAADPKYRDFHASLVPNEDKGRILGVRMPRLRKIARAAGKAPEEYGGGSSATNATQEEESPSASS